LGKHHDDGEHPSAHRHAGVHGLPKADEVYVVLLEEFHQLGEVRDATSESIQLHDDDRVDVASGDGRSETLQLRPPLILRTPAGINE
jgi:hypothetical protein